MNINISINVYIMEVILQKSNKPDKKYMVMIDGKIIHFGAKAKKISQRVKTKIGNRYIIRHNKN